MKPPYVVIASLLITLLLPCGGESVVRDGSSEVWDNDIGVVGTSREGSPQELVVTTSPEASADLVQTTRRNSADGSVLERSIASSRLSRSRGFSSWILGLLVLGVLGAAALTLGNNARTRLSTNAVTEDSRQSVAGTSGHHVHQSLSISDPPVLLADSVEASQLQTATGRSFKREQLDTQPEIGYDSEARKSTNQPSAPQDSIVSRVNKADIAKSTLNRTPSSLGRNEFTVRRVPTIREIVAHLNELEQKMSGIIDEEERHFGNEIRSLEMQKFSLSEVLTSQGINLSHPTQVGRSHGEYESLMRRREELQAELISINSQIRNTEEQIESVEDYVQALQAWRSLDQASLLITIIHSAVEQVNGTGPSKKNLKYPQLLEALRNSTSKTDHSSTGLRSTDENETDIKVVPDMNIKAFDYMLEAIRGIDGHSSPVEEGQMPNEKDAVSNGPEVSVDSMEAETGGGSGLASSILHSSHSNVREKIGKFALQAMMELWKVAREIAEDDERRTSEVLRRDLSRLRDRLQKTVAVDGTRTQLVNGHVEDFKPLYFSDTDQSSLEAYLDAINRVQESISMEISESVGTEKSLRNLRDEEVEKSKFLFDQISALTYEARAMEATSKEGTVKKNDAYTQQYLEFQELRLDNDLDSARNKLRSTRQWRTETEAAINAIRTELMLFSDDLENRTLSPERVVA